MMYEINSLNLTEANKNNMYSNLLIFILAFGKALVWLIHLHVMCRTVGQWFVRHRTYKGTSVVLFGELHVEFLDT